MLESLFNKADPSDQFFRHATWLKKDYNGDISDISVSKWAKTTSLVKTFVIKKRSFLELHLMYL